MHVDLCNNKRTLLKIQRTFIYQRLTARYPDNPRKNFFFFSPTPVSYLSTLPPRPGQIWPPVVVVVVQEGREHGRSSVCAQPHLIIVNQVVDTSSRHSNDVLAWGLARCVQEAVVKLSPKSTLSCLSKMFMFTGSRLQRLGSRTSLSFLWSKVRCLFLRFILHIISCLSLH